MNINIENIDAKKADLGLRHEYIPNTQFNMEQPEDERIVVESLISCGGSGSAQFKHACSGAH